MHPLRIAVTSSTLVLLVALGWGVSTGDVDAGSATSTPDAAVDTAGPVSLPTSTLYDPDVLGESVVPDKWTGVGPYNSDFPCGGLSVAEAAQLFPEVTTAHIDGNTCYYGPEFADGDTWPSVLWIDVHEVPTAAEAADWLAYEEQIFYNLFGTSAGDPLPGGECQPTDALGDRGLWCEAPDGARLIVIAGTVGFTIDLDVQQDRQVYVDIATMIVANISPEPAETAPATTAAP